MELKQSKWIYWLMLGLAYVVYSFVSVAAKMAATQEFIFMTVFYICLEIAFLAIYAILWQQILKQISLVVAMAYKGISLILTLAWSILFFSENITIYNVIGSLFIIAGIWMIAVDE